MASESTAESKDAMAAGDGASGAAATGRMPTLYLSHGGGPCFFLPDEGMFKGMGRGSTAHKFFQSLAASLPKPKAILVISAHWEERKPTVYRVDGDNELLFDYYGFPAETYRLKWPTKGSTFYADRVTKLLSDAGISSDKVATRGLDHGTFVPLKAVWDEGLPDVAVLQLSLIAGLDPEQHYKLGEALAPLRDEGVLIIGSGSATHNMRSMGGASREVVQGCRDFDEWLKKTLTSEEYDDDRRRAEALRVATKPFFRHAHPREEHLTPMYVAFGAAHGARGRQLYQQWMAETFSQASYQWE